DAAGNVRYVYNPRGYRTDYTYDALNQRRSVTEATNSPDSRTTYTDYDEAGHVLLSTDARGVATSYAYDALGRRTQIVQAFSVPSDIPNPTPEATTTLNYDVFDNVVQSIDPLTHTTS